MKNIAKIINFNTVAAIFALLFTSSCEMTPDKSIEPQSELSNVDASARKGVIINSPPVGGCPEGYIWNNTLGECVPTTSYPDINPSTITFNETQSTFQNVQNTNATVKATPGSIINGKQYWRHQIYVGGAPTNEKMIVAIYNASSTLIYTDYYDIAGKHIGKLGVINGNQFYSWKPSYSGTPDGSGFAGRGFLGGWGKCVAGVASQMTNGSAISSLSMLACWAWSGPCAAAVGIGCAISAAGGVWN
jgi:hypothetical protein